MRDVELDWQINLVENEINACMTEISELLERSVACRMAWRHTAGEWIAVQNSLIELRNRRAGDD